MRLKCTYQLVVDIVVTHEPDTDPSLTGAALEHLAKRNLDSGEGRYHLGGLFRRDIEEGESPVMFQSSVLAVKARRA